MWVSVTFAYLVPAVAITTRLLSHHNAYARPLARPDGVVEHKRDFPRQNEWLLNQDSNLGDGVCG